MKRLAIFLRFDGGLIKRGSLKKLKPLLLCEKKKDLTKNSRKISIAIDEDNKLFTLDPVELYKKLQLEFGKNLRIECVFLEYEMVIWSYSKDHVWRIELPVNRKFSETIRSALKIKMVRPIE